MKILIFKGGGIAAPSLIESIVPVLKSLRHRVRLVFLKNEVQNIQRELNSFHPDLVFALDHTGVDDLMLKSINQYYCSWFVDNPLYFIDKDNICDYHICAYSDPWFLNILNDLGSKKNIFLPLAYDESIFYKTAKSDEKLFDVTYVGSYPGSESFLKKNRSLVINNSFEEIIEQSITLKKENPEIYLYDILKISEKELGINLAGMLLKYQKGGLLNFIDQSIDAHNKNMMLNVLKKFNYSIFGNDLWMQIIKLKASFKGSLNYGPDLADIYRKTKINIIITRPQIAKGVNQRVFDIPAVGSFFLCDYREELKNIFPDIWQKISYQTFAELEEKINYFLNHEEEREELTKKMYYHIHHHHSYAVRMEQMILNLNKIIN